MYKSLKTVLLDSTPWIPDSSYWILDSFQWNLHSGFQSLVGSWIPLAVAYDSGFHKQNFPDSRIQISFTQGPPTPKH